MIDTLCKTHVTIYTPRTWACKLPSGIRVATSKGGREEEKMAYLQVAIAVKDFSDGGEELKVEDGK